MLPKPETLKALLLAALAVMLLTSPVWAGEWIVTFAALTLLALGISQLIQAFRQSEPWAAYLQGALIVLGGGLFLLRHELAINAAGKVAALAMFAFAALRIVELVRSPAERAVAAGHVLTAITATFVGILAWRFTANATMVAALVAACWLLSVAWAMFWSDTKSDAEIRPADAHPDRALGLPAADDIAELNAHMKVNNPLRSPLNLEWLGLIALLLLIIHTVRMSADVSLVGMIPPMTATIGDLLVAVVAFWVVVLPLRMAWRKATRGLERRLWRERRSGSRSGDMPVNVFVNRLSDAWLDGRYAFAFRLERTRRSLVDGLLMAVGGGVMVAAVFVAINSMWGFSWYFNTENWASGIYQAVTGPRVDRWREAMTDAVTRQRHETPAAAFTLQPKGVGDGQDFSFLVIGDPGEGDASQLSLKDRYTELAARDDVKFIVLSSDIIYPAGEMKDYERNFYMPFKGVRKPIYAIPGNHDWFNALEAFNANLLSPDAARAAISARIDEDRGLTLTTERRRDAMIAEAARLRDLYRLQTGLQNGPYFDIQTKDFALIAIDTGVLKSVDPAQEHWLEERLAAAKGKFILALVGHPRYAGGNDTVEAGTAFARLYGILERHNVAITMAGDTHDFEYYVQPLENSRGSIHHVLNGGGGAYLSIGTALDWPASPPTTHWAYYPSTKAVQQKLANETPLWKRPPLMWINLAKAWPFSVEALSGIFDFNKAPFFQSFVEVQVKPQLNEVRLLLHGVNGLLTWGDLDRSGKLATEHSPSDSVIITLPL